jgi:hypothetical protein
MTLTLIIIAVIVLFLVLAYYMNWFGVIAGIIDIVSEAIIALLMCFTRD